jgi:hypothetical protein
MLLLVFMLCACGGEGNNDTGDGISEALKERAKPAERSLTKLRDAVVKFYAAKKEAPRSVNDLAGYGGGPDDLETSDDYADIGLTFFSSSLKFDAQGNLARGWFLATPKGTSDALQVRMNGVTGGFEYLRKGEKWKAAEEDEGWAPGEKPKPDEDLTTE